MKAFIQKIVAWPFSVEVLIGFTGIAVLFRLLDLLMVAMGQVPSYSDVLPALIIFNFLSVIYEKFWDSHGWSWSDVLWRIPGQILAVLLWKGI